MLRAVSPGCFILKPSKPEKRELCSRLEHGSHGQSVDVVRLGFSQEATADVMGMTLRSTSKQAWHEGPRGLAMDQASRQISHRSRCCTVVGA